MSTSGKPIIEFQRVHPWEVYPEIIRDVIEKSGARRVCDVGGGAFPQLSLDYIRQHTLEYTVLDISARELARTPAGYGTVQADICAADFVPVAAYDVVCSKMLAEHIAMPQRFHANVRGLLRPGGIAVHFFPTLYALPFVINRIVPEPLARFLFYRFACNDVVEHKKFPAYYRWCRGPTPGQVARFVRSGYEVLRYYGFFGHQYYERVAGLRQLQRCASWVAYKTANPYWTSFAVVVLKRPER